MVSKVRRGAIWWADLGAPRGSDPGYRRPVLIVQDDHFNQSRLATVLVLPLTSNLKYQNFPGNIYLSTAQSGLPKDSVVNVAQLTVIDKGWLDEHVADLSTSVMMQVEHSLSLILGL